MRKDIKLETDNNFLIYWTLDTINSNRLIIFVHWFTGNKNEHHYFNAVPFFNKKWFDTFRFDFYSGNPNAKSLSNCSLSEHSKDLELVIENFKNDYQEIILVGHSLWPLSILKANLSNISKLIFWDPTTKLSDLWEKDGVYNEKIDKYIFSWNIDFLVDKQMIEEWKSINIPKLMNKLTIPCSIIFAGAYNKHKLRKPILKETNTEIKSVIIPWASHGFVEEWTELKLFEETLKLL